MRGMVMRLRDEPVFTERVEEVLDQIKSNPRTARRELWRVSCPHQLYVQLGAEFLNTTNPWCVIQVVIWLACEELLNETNARSSIGLNPTRLSLTAVNLHSSVWECDFLQQSCQADSYPFIWAGVREFLGGRVVGYDSFDYAFGAENPNGCWLSPLRSNGAFSSADDRSPRVWHYDHQGAFVEVRGELVNGRLTPQQLDLYPFDRGCIYAAAALDSQGH